MASAAAAAPGSEQLQPDDLRVRCRRRSGSASPSASDDEAGDTEAPAPQQPQHQQQQQQQQQQQFSQLSQLLRPGGGGGTEPAILRCESNECQFQTQSRAALDAHARTHSDRRFYECDVCRMRFTNGANLRRHRMRHTGIKPYECRSCSKRFFRRDHLLEHMSTHVKAAGRRLPWQCPVCAKGFQRQIAMRAHYQNEHVRDGDWSRTCKLCGFGAECWQSLHTHLAEQHGVTLGAPPTPPTPLLLPHHFLAPVQLTMDGDSPPGSPRPSQQSPNSSQASPNSSSQVSEALLPAAAAAESPAAPAAPPPGLSTMIAVKPEPEEAVPEPQVPPSADDDAREPQRQLAAGEPADVDAGRLGQQAAPAEADIRVQQTSAEGDACRLLTPTSPVSHSPSPGDPAGGDGAGASRLRSLLQQRRPASRSEPPALAALLQPRRSQLCTFCGILFPDRTLYFLHKGCHAENNPWKCNICSEVCHNVYEFNSHLLSQPHQ